MKEIRIISEGNQRKEVAREIAEMLGVTAEYAGVPSCDYIIGSSRLDKEWVFHPGEDLTEEQTEDIFVHHCEHDAKEKVAEELEQDKLAIAVPNVGFTDEALDNLQKLMTAKKTILQHAFQCEDLKIKIIAEKVIFDWFPFTTEPDEVDAYTEFVSKLCNLAQSVKRVQGKEKQSDNEKYTFRCFLLRLGFIGDEYKNARKILIKNLTGNSAFRYGK